jgi:hypothetical protein
MTSEAQPARSAGTQIVQLLETALAPVEPRASFSDELESRLASVQAAALEELADWELAAMRDPRNWARPVAALAVGGAAGAALLVVRMRRSRKDRSGIRGIADQGRRELAGALAEARALIR